MKEAFKEAFSFTKKETRAILVLCSCILILLGVISFYEKIDSPKETSTNEAWLNEAMASVYTDTSSSRKYSNAPSQLKPFNFNPNTLDEAGWLKLGLKARTVKTILNYRNKGGRFYKKEDLKKMYSLHEKEYTQLAPYITIPKQVYNNSYPKSDYVKKKEAQSKIIVPINKASAIEFAELNGIGEKLSSNILKYRKMLGGFSNINQLQEVYGIRPETFANIKKQLRCDASGITKININEATYYEMKSHPYLRDKNWALAITKFRKSQDYEIKQLEDLLQIEGMNKETYNKIVPYLRLQ